MNTHKNILLAKKIIQGFLNDWFYFHRIGISEVFVLFHEIPYSCATELIFHSVLLHNFNALGVQSFPDCHIQTHKVEGINQCSS